MELVDPVTNKFYNQGNDSLLSRLPAIHCYGAPSLTAGEILDRLPGRWIGKDELPAKSLHLFNITGDSTGLPHGSVNDIGEDSSGHIWIGTNGGVCCLDPETNLFTTFTTNDGLPSNKISGIIVDGRNRVWMSTAGALWFTISNCIHSEFLRWLMVCLPTSLMNKKHFARTMDTFAMLP
jgi:hypothetical protein